MRFEDLPDNWTTLPLDDAPLAAGVIDLIIGHHDRGRNTMLILPCDEHDVGLPAPVLVSDVDWLCTSRERREAMAVLPAIASPGFVLGLSARRRLPDEVVGRWLRTIEDELDASGQALLALGVADVDTVEIVGGRAVRGRQPGRAAG
ncbi:hypothetical protein [Dietzia sp. CH92]|uniref:hypothetical protein n=1 Tax=Dietzia sp. CH92 TaxID=3051823 RepID=UPI0028D7D8AB|nr:hypothetical protein [Dietzia sp. CH92]